MAEILAFAAQHLSEAQADDLAGWLAQRARRAPVRLGPPPARARLERALSWHTTGDCAKLAAWLRVRRAGGDYTPVIRKHARAASSTERT